MSDPVASRSAFLQMYMTNHPDTLIAYVKHFGGVTANASSAEAKYIDSKTGDVGSVRVEFDPPTEELKPRLRAMKAEAQEALGMLHFPTITTFRPPFGAASTIYFLLLAIAYITDVVFMPAHLSLNVLGIVPPARSIFQFTVAAHGFETLYTWHLCRRYVKGIFVTAAYLSAAFVFGFLVWVDLRKRVQEKRIESLMKAE